jgi:spermidine/putrescine transport system permease protein
MKKFIGLYVPAATLIGYVFLFAPLVVLVVYAFNAGRTTVVWGRLFARLVRRSAR